MADSFQPDSFVADSFAPEEPEKPKEKFRSKVNRAAFNTVSGGIEALNAPFEVAGEVARRAVEANNPGGFRMPSIVQRLLPSTRTPEPPMNPVSLVNKLLRAGTGAIAGLPPGGQTPLESARTAYNADRGAMGVAEDTAMGLLLGKIAPQTLAAPMDAAVVGASKAVKGARDVASGLTKKAVRVALGPPEEAQSILFNRPQDVTRQTNFQDLGERLAQTTNDLSKKVGELDNIAWDSLLKLKAEPRSKILSILKTAKQEFVGTGKTKIGNADRQAAKQIDSYIERIQEIKQAGVDPKLEQFLDQPQLKEIIQSIQKDARYDLPETDPVNRAVQMVRSLIDKYLKKENPGYEDAMKPVAEATDALKDTIKRFRLERHPEQGFLPTKVTVDRLSASVKGKSPELTRTFEKLKNTTGTDFLDEAKLTATKEQFTPGVQRTAGGRRTYAGSFIGGGMGAMLSKLLGIPTSLGAGAGSVAGTAAGAAADYYGGAAAKTLIDMLSKGRTGTGNVLSAINAKTQGTPIQEVLKRILAEQPVLGPMLRESR